MLRLVHDLTRFDRPLMIEHFCSLNGTDRYLRFGLPRDDGSLKEYVEAIDFERDLVLGVFGPGFKLVAVAHVGLIDDTAELGLSVLPEFRRQNLASLAVQRAARRARANGAKKLWIHFLRENRAILAFARKNKMRIELRDAEGDAYLPLPPVGQLTYVFDLYQSQLALLARAWRVSGV
ncbi:MAG: GNAT family N-acetyltransferase [Gammaproteobacteria bacterium]|nr:GNAT family N-acetyltransferase [Gammaproteobacteria bacterium]